jgi:predicted ATPase/class 3 adenylate cyclase
MATLPTRNVTFFFSDIEGSTRLLESLGDAYEDLLARHRRIVRAALAERGAAELGTEGDSFFAVFASANDAVASATEIQRAMTREAWPDGASVRVRIGIHSGVARVTDSGYVGLDVHRAARIMATGHGGQIVISDATASLAGPAATNGIRFRDLGEHRLRDLSGRERLFQVVADGLPSEFPRLRTLDVTPNNLPTQPSELIGRTAELATIRQHLDSGTARLLTLIGPGGIGKTRVAVQAAAQQIDRFIDGVFFVDLSAIRDPSEALEAMIRTIGEGPPGERAASEAMAEQVGTRHMLLVLDNFEQVMGAAEPVAELLRRCPQLGMLVTSRQALRVRGEQLIPLAPLPQPDMSGRIGAADAERYDAVRLFVERAREAQPDFALTDANATIVADICGRLDGLPLAIELAAARLTLFSVEELRDRLRSRLALLRGGARDLPERQRTLIGTIEWSYELLGEDERLVFQLLSAFESARIDAVEAVAAAVPGMASDVIEALGTLVDKSLVRRTDDGRSQRLTMLDSIREYAELRLVEDAARASAVRRAHAEYFAAFAQDQRAALSGQAREAALDALASELGNLQGAWRRSVEEADVARLNQLLDPIWMLHEARGWYHGAVAVTNDALALLARSERTAVEAQEEITLRMGIARGLLAVRGYTEEVERLYQEALALSERTRPAADQLPFLRGLASYHVYRGEIDKAAVVGRRLLDLGEQQGDSNLLVEGHLILGPALGFLGDSTAAIEHLDTAIALFDPERHGRGRFRLGPNPGVAARAVSGLLHWVFGYPERADRLGRSAIELAAELSHPYSLAYATFHVGVLDLWNGRDEAAHARAAEVIAIARKHDYQVWEAVGLVLSGVGACRLGRIEEGLSASERGLEMYGRSPAPPVFWPQLLTLRAEALFRAGRLDGALEQIDRALAFAGEGTWDTAAARILKADLLVAGGDPDSAVPILQMAVQESQLMAVPMIALQAATRIATIGSDERRDEATALLRDLLDKIGEDGGTPAIADARAALNGTRVI